MKIQFSRAVHGDAEKIQELYKQLVDDPNIGVSAKSIEKISKDENNFLITAKLEGEIVATAFLVICRDVMYSNQPFAIIENIVIDSKFRRRGIGKSLMNHLSSLCKAEKCTKIMLLSSSKRTDAHSFFEECGYKSDVKKGFVNYINR